MEKWILTIQIDDANEVDLKIELGEADCNHVLRRRRNNKKYPDKNAIYTLTIDVDDSDNKNAVEAIVETCGGKIEHRTKKPKPKRIAKLIRYSKRRIVDLISIYFGIVSTGIPVLTKNVNEEIVLVWDINFMWMFILAFVPTSLYFITGLRNFNKRSIQDD